MTGIEVLAMQEVVTKSAFNWTAFWIAFGIVFGIVVIFGIIVSLLSYDWSNLLCSIVVGLFLEIIVGAAFGDTLRIPTAYETQYKVTVSDEVPMNEFLEKYEIIDQEGKIYTITERQ